MDRERVFECEKHVEEISAFRKLRVVGIPGARKAAYEDMKLEGRQRSDVYPFLMETISVEFCLSLWCEEPLEGFM